MVAENTCFNFKTYINFMCIEGAPVLHTVYDAMHFSAAQFFDTLITDSVPKMMLMLWVLVYFGLSNTLVFDDNPKFRDNF